MKDASLKAPPGMKGVVIDTKSAARITVDAAVAGIGIVPNIDLATDAGLHVDDGIVVLDRPPVA